MAESVGILKTTARCTFNLIEPPIGGFQVKTETNVTEFRENSFSPPLSHKSLENPVPDLQRTPDKDG